MGTTTIFLFRYRYLTTIWLILLRKIMLLTVQLICLFFLNLCFFNFLLTPNKSLRLKRFRRSYVNCTAVVLINHCQCYTAFLLDVRRSKWPRSLFCSCLFLMIMHLHNLFLWSTCVADCFLALLTPSWINN